MRQLMNKEDSAHKLEETAKLNKNLQPLMQWLFCEPNPIAINTALMMTSAVSPNFRLPYQALTLEQRQEGLDLLATINVSERVGDSLSLLADTDFNYCA